jgi:hypothetical protein
MDERRRRFQCVGGLDYDRDLSNELKRAQNYRLPTSTIQNISGLPQGLADLIAAVCMSSIGGRQGAALRAWAVARVS